MFDIQREIRRAVLEPLRDLVPKIVRDLFTRGDGITYITALGTVTADYVSGLPQVQFDRDAAASGKGYEYVAAYVPAANDRVVLLRVGNGWLILGKVVNA